MKKWILMAALGLFLPLAGQAQDNQLDKKNLVIKEWNTDPRGGHKVLDHVTTYSPSGQKIEEIEYDSAGQKWRKRFERDAA